MAPTCGRGEKPGSHGISLCRLHRWREGSQQSFSERLASERDQAPVAMLSELLETHGCIGAALPPQNPTLEGKTHTQVDQHSKGLQAQHEKSSSVL